MDLRYKGQTGSTSSTDDITAGFTDTLAGRIHARSNREKPSSSVFIVENNRFVDFHK
jgi:hypothetical protein